MYYGLFIMMLLWSVYYYVYYCLFIMFILIFDIFLKVAQGFYFELDVNFLRVAVKAEVSVNRELSIKLLIKTD